MSWDLQAALNYVAAGGEKRATKFGSWGQRLIFRAVFDESFPKISRFRRVGDTL